MIFTSDSKPNINFKLVGDTIKVGRKVALSIKKSMGLKFHPILIDVTTIVTFDERTMTLKGKLTKKNGGI
jgi:hypothetical protein